MAKTILNKNVRKNIFVAGLIIIPVIHFIIFWGVVNFNSILMSFQRVDTATGQTVYGFDNFREVFRLFQTGTLSRALVNTLLTSGFLTVFMLPWGFFVTYFLYKKIRFHGLWRTMMFTPSILPAVAMSAIFIYLVNPAGPVGKVWEILSGSPAPAFLMEPKIAKWTILIYIFWTNFGGQFILFSGAMARIPKEVIESARLDGASMWKEMLKIVLPLCWPTFSMLLLLNLAAIFTATGPILLLTNGDADTNTISFWIYQSVQGGTAKGLNEAAALGIICTVILFPIMMLARWGLSKIYADVEF